MLSNDLTNVEDFFYAISTGDRVRVLEAKQGSSPAVERVYRVQNVDAKKPRFTAVCGRSTRTVELIRCATGSRILSWTPSMNSFPVNELELLVVN